jgi:hypothetical protein
MLEELFNLVKDHSQEDIIQNQAIPNEMNNHAVGMATDSIFSGLQGAMANGGIGSILSLLGGKSSVGSGNPLVSGIMQNFAGGLMSKFGITNPIAQSIAASLIPKALSGLVGRTSNPQDSGFNINGLIGSLMGNNTPASSQNPIATQGGGGFDFNSILSSLTGGAQVQAPSQATQHDQSGFGMDDILKMVTGGGAQQQQQSAGGLQDILKMVTGGAQQQQQQQSGGGVMDMLKGFMGN